MEKNEINIKESDVIDVGYLLKVLLKRAWAILAISVIFAGMMFGYTKLFIKPKYSSSTMLYVNNRTVDVGSFSAAELTAAQSLVDTYVVILKNRTTIKEVMKAAEIDETEYSWQTILNSIQATPIEGTEVFKVTVTMDDPETAAKIALAITEVLKGTVEDIIKGSTMSIVDKPSINRNPVGPNTTKNAVIGFALGFLLSCGLFIVFALLDDTIRDEDYIAQTFDKPILAQVPDLMFDDKADLRYEDYVKVKGKAEIK